MSYIPPNINGQATMANSGPVVLASDQTPFADISTNGNLNSLNATVSITSGSRGVVAIEITGTWVGTITFQGTSDPSGVSAVDANWYTINAPSPTVTIAGSTTNLNGLFRVNSGGYTAVRAKMTAYTSGTATAWFNASDKSSLITLAEPITIGADPDTVVSGTITTTDAVVGAHTGTGSLLSGTPTVGSYIFLLCPGGDSAWNIQLTGTFGGGTVYFEESLDSTNGIDGSWINVNGRQTGVLNTLLAFGVTTAGVFRGNTSGAKYVRTRIIGATSPSVLVVIRTSSGTGAIFLNAGLPTGNDIIGATIQSPDATSTFAPTNATSTAYEASRVIKVTAGNLYSVIGFNSKATSQFVQLHNASALPAEASVPVVFFLVPALSNFALDYAWGRFFSTGMVICNSSTGPTKTLGTTDCFWDIQFK